MINVTLWCDAFNCLCSAFAVASVQLSCLTALCAVLWMGFDGVIIVSIPHSLMQSKCHESSSFFCLTRVVCCAWVVYCGAHEVLTDIFRGNLESSFEVRQRFLICGTQSSTKWYAR